MKQSLRERLYALEDALADYSLTALLATNAIVALLTVYF
jgi:hypothetical protein